MGTRGLTMLISGEKPKIAQYGQWDHYPDGQGLTILQFLRKMSVTKFQKQLGKCKFIGKRDEDDANEYANAHTDIQFNKKYPFLTRDHGGMILELVYKSRRKEILLEDSSSFAGESLHCEYGYVIDLDKNTFEIYRGFNRDPLPLDQRFAYLNDNHDNDYFPISFMKEYSLNDLPTKEEFLKDLVEKEEE